MIFKGIFLVAFLFIFNKNNLLWTLRTQMQFFSSIFILTDEATEKKNNNKKCHSNIFSKAVK